MAIYSSNPNANRNFHIEEKFEAGVVLSGSEVKSIKNGKISIKESYAIIKKGEIYVCLLYTSPSPRDRQKSRMPSSA